MRQIADWVERCVGVTLALLGGLAFYNLVFNNAYVFGATLHDSTIFETIIWRTDLALTQPAVLGGFPFLRTHFSPIMLVPNALSYIFPGTHLQFFALVYAAIYALGMYLGFRVLRAGGWRVATAAFGALVFFCCQASFLMGWEPHMEVLCPFFGILTLWAWQQRQYYWAFIWHALNASVREDIALLFLAPILLMGLAQYLSVRRTHPGLARERLRWVGYFVAYSLLVLAVAVGLQKAYFPGFNLFSFLYFDPQAPFAHLTPEIMTQRLRTLGEHRTGVWMPLLVMLLAAGFMRDWQVLAGAVCFVPFLLFNIISKFGDSGDLGSYKAFPVVMVMLWPTLVSFVAPSAKRGRYRILQALVLGAGVWYIIGVPSSPYLRDIPKRWISHTASIKVDAYEDFHTRLKEIQKTGPLRATQGVLALYPYDFPIWTDTNVSDFKEQDIDSIKILLFFEEDRDYDRIKRLLNLRPFKIQVVEGTMIRIATRKTE